MKVGGYQGQRSIMTESLAVFCRLAAASGLPKADLTIDVTATRMTARGLFDGVEAGRFQVCYIASGYLAARVPELALLDTPFHVTDRERALAALDGRAGGLLAQAIAARTGLHVLAYWDNGFRHISNGVRAIMSPVDCEGLTIRTLDSPNYVATLKAIGFTPVVTDVAEFREAIASGRIAAQENPLTNMLNFGIEQHHKHVSLTSHLFGVALLVCNRVWRDGLSRAEREALDATAMASTEAQRRFAAAEDRKALKRLKSAGCHVLRPDLIDRQAFLRATIGVQTGILDAALPALRMAYADL